MNLCSISGILLMLPFLLVDAVDCRVQRQKPRPFALAMYDVLSVFATDYGTMLMFTPSHPY